MIQQKVEHLNTSTFTSVSLKLCCSCLFVLTLNAPAPSACRRTLLLRKYEAGEKTPLRFWPGEIAVKQRCDVSLMTGIALIKKKQKQKRLAREHIFPAETPEVCVHVSNVCMSAYRLFSLLLLKSLIISDRKRRRTSISSALGVEFFSSVATTFRITEKTD